jgi:hypothetical protein
MRSKLALTCGVRWRCSRTLTFSGRSPHWPVLTRPRLAGFQVSTEAPGGHRSSTPSPRSGDGVSQPQLGHAWVTTAGPHLRVSPRRTEWLRVTCNASATGKITASPSNNESQTITAEIGVPQGGGHGDHRAGGTLRRLVAVRQGRRTGIRLPLPRHRILRRGGA